MMDFLFPSFLVCNFLDAVSHFLCSPANNTEYTPRSMIGNLVCQCTPAHYPNADVQFFAPAHSSRFPDDSPTRRCKVLPGRFQICFLWHYSNQRRWPSSPARCRICSGWCDPKSLGSAGQRQGLRITLLHFNYWIHGLLLSRIMIRRLYGYWYQR